MFAVLVGVALWGCAESALDPPALARLEPSSGYGKIEEPVTILGEGFALSPGRDLSGGEEFLLRADFSGLLRAGDGSLHELLGLARIDDQTLSARVPGGLAEGLYALELSGPTGTASALLDAYRVVAALEVLPPAAPPDLGLTWVSLTGKTFLMGGDSLFSPIDEFPLHLVTMPGFKILKTEVTVAQYRICASQGPCSAPGAGATCNFGHADRESHPINCVDFAQADAFCRWVGGRLPSESEWEFASRGGLDVIYPWGNATPTCDRAVHFDTAPACGLGTSAAVCSKPAGNTPEGLCDMAGNVWEWVQDWYHDSYNGAPPDGAAWMDPNTGQHLYRGGSWGSSAEYLRSSYRGLGPATPTDQDGFRCAMNPG